MSGRRRILCAVDFSQPAQAAFEQALALSRDRNAELTVVHAVSVNQRFNWRGAQRMDQIAAMRRAAGAIGVRMRATEQQGDAAGVILLHANAGLFDLIVLGTHQRTGLERLRVGSVAGQVTQRARCPVLIVPVPHHGSRGAVAAFRNIVCPVDFSAGATVALEHALQLVKGGGRLTVLHVLRALDPIITSRPASPLMVPEYRRWLWRDAWRRLQEAIPAKAGETSDVRARVVSGTPAVEIARIAGEVDADLLVIGVTSRGVLGRWIIGATAARVIRTVGRPVLAVPERMLEGSSAGLGSQSVTRPAA